MKKFKYNINNLDCANCAREVEEGLSKDTRLNNVRVNFNTCKISYESDCDISIGELNKMVSRIEPSASISENSENEYHIGILLLSIFCAIIGVFNKFFLIMAYILLLYKIFINALKGIINKSINENLLILISSIGAFIIGSEFEGLMVVLLYTIGKLLENRAVNKSRDEVKKLIDIEPFVTDVDNKSISVYDVKVGDKLLIKKGERILVDGKVINAKALLDMSSLTGESKLVSTSDIVLSGSINMGDAFNMEVTNVFYESTVSKILELVEDATDKKANIENFVSRFSRIYTPIVLMLALIVSIFLPLLGISAQDSIYRGLTFLVISCPCAIAISVPLSYFAGIGISSKHGILIKGSNYLDIMGRINKVIFDKTGTLTDGDFSINIDVIDKKYTIDEIKEILVMGESLSNHPIAKSFMKLGSFDNSKVKNFKEVDGRGISYKIDDKNIIVGNSKFCNCKFDSLIHLNINGKHVASISITDSIRKSSYDCISFLKKNNIKTYMFTGDKKDIALSIGESLGVDDIRFEMLPADKYKNYEEIKGNDIVCFVGDGVNDAPTLKRADVGISIGGVDAATRLSDIVLMSDDLTKINTCINISRFTNFIIKENLVFAILTKIIILILSIFGLTNMWFAVFADTGVTVITVLNSLRILKK